MNYTTRLTLKKLWFNLIKSGKKMEEYRPITPYYQARLCADYSRDNPWCADCAKNYCHPHQKVYFVHFTLGYPKDDDLEKHMVKKVTSIRKSYGKRIWGADPGRKCFVLKLEDVNGR